MASRLRDERVNRVSVAGVAVDEARLAHLAYAPEIAGAMLRRQQAEAILAARRLIVRGAVGMVENALADLNERAAWSSWTRTARRPWSPTCWWCCAPTARPSRS